MTIIVATKRDTFAVLAADQFHGSNSGPPQFATKLATHTKLPLAFAVGGASWWPIGTPGRPATAHLQDFAATIRSMEELVVSDLAEKLRILVQPAMEHMQDKTTIYIALCKNGQPSLGIQQVSATRLTDDPTRFIPLCEPFMPPAIRAFFHQESLCSSVHDSSITKPDAVGESVRVVIQKCMDHEKSNNNNGQNRTIGGTIQVAIIEPSGPPWVI